jgi:oligopeptide/dipeptide ABC transporter ATP-binding protein
VTPLLEIAGLQLEFTSGHSAVRVLDGVSLTIHKGETLALVGESGSGKSVTALSIARLLPSPPARYTAGQIVLNGQDVLRASAAQLRQWRGAVVSYIFQEPGSSLHPVFPVGRQIMESLRLHRPDSATEGEVVRLLRVVGISAPEERSKSLPHELSGGMQQRVMIALALASQPQLLVADEPTTALDVTIQAQILELLRTLRKQLDMSMLLITHNLGIVRQMADRVAVMYAGQIVEMAAMPDLLGEPFHPYTEALIKSVPRLGAANERLVAIPGNVPNLTHLPPGCRFEPRCPIARPDCATRPPALVEVKPGRWVRCPYWNAAR